MNILALFSALVLFAGGSAFADNSMQIQMLQNEISSLRLKIQDDGAKLEQCAASVKGFQIAGGVTLGLTAVGVGVNVYQAVGRKNTQKEVDDKDRELKSKQASLASLKAKEADKIIAKNGWNIENCSQMSPGGKADLKTSVDEALAIIEQLKNSNYYQKVQTDEVKLREIIEKCGLQS
jgi:hypothetical protein